MAAAVAGTVAVRLAANTTKFVAGMNKARQAIFSLDTAARAFDIQPTILLGKAFKRLGSILTKFVTIPLVGFLVLSIREFVKFEAAVVRATALLENNIAGTQIRLMELSRDLAKTFDQSAADISEGFFFLIQAGFSTEKAFESLSAVVAFATAGQFDLKTATDLSTDAMTAFGLASTDAEEQAANLLRVMDALVKASRLGNATVQQFSEALTNRAAVAAKTLGFSLDETIAALIELAKAGIKGRVAGTRLEITMRNLTTKAIENKKQFDSLGISVFDAAGQTRDFPDIIEDLTNSLAGASDASKLTALEMLGFEARSRLMILALLGTSESMRKSIKETQKQGTTADVAQEQLKKLETQFKLLKKAIVDVAITIGKDLAPIVFEIVVTVTAWINAFGELDKETRKTILIIAGLLIVIGPLLVLLGTFLVILPLLVLGFVALLALLPIIVVAVVALAAVFASLTISIIGIIDLFTGGDFINAIKSTFADFGKEIDESREKMKKFFEDLKKDRKKAEGDGPRRALLIEPKEITDLTKAARTATKALNIDPLNKEFDEATNRLEDARRILRETRAELNKKGIDITEAAMERFMKAEITLFKTRMRNIKNVFAEEFRLFVASDRAKRLLELRAQRDRLLNQKVSTKKQERAIISEFEKRRELLARELAVEAIQKRGTEAGTIGGLRAIEAGTVEGFRAARGIENEAEKAVIKNEEHTAEMNRQLQELIRLEEKQKQEESATTVKI